MEIKEKLKDLINDIDSDLEICKNHFKYSDSIDDDFFTYQQINLMRLREITDILSEIIQKI
ncbi:MAG: hypothetical protein IJQ28_05765 [Clostridia bacterium]|nr:hypothetical protein [Clostridia bacterium]MBQ6907868.1 hypothetical protein [Clostridia bacterium]